MKLDDVDDYIRLHGADAVAARIFYNIGASSFRHPCWTNIDHPSEWYARFQGDMIAHDLMGDDPLPIDDGSAEIVYSSHTIEHISDEAALRLLAEAFRVLRPGGTLRVTTGPDAETNYRALQRGDADWFALDDAYAHPSVYRPIYHAPPESVPLAEQWLNHVASQLAPNDRSPSPVKYEADAIDEIVQTKGFPACLDHFTSLCENQPDRPGNHMSWWTHDKLIDAMRSVGFETVYRSGYSQSASPVLRNTAYFDNTHPKFSLYVEAVR